MIKVVFIFYFYIIHARERILPTTIESSSAIDYKIISEYKDIDESLNKKFKIHSEPDDLPISNGYGDIGDNIDENNPY